MRCFNGQKCWEPVHCSHLPRVPSFRKYRVCLEKQTWLLMCGMTVVGHTSIDANLGKEKIKPSKVAGLNSKSVSSSTVLFSEL